MNNGSEPAAGARASHRWRFFRAGGFDQAQLSTGADLVALESLDQKLWVALSGPVAGISFAEKRRPWGLYPALLALAAVLLYLWRTGYLAQWLGQ